MGVDERRYPQLGVYVPAFAKPGNLPITQPVKFNLEINLKTAKALKLVIPESFLRVADKVFR